MPRFADSPTGCVRDVRALVATADAAVAAWARDRLPAAGLILSAEAADAQRTVELAAGHDLCLLDVALPGGAMTALGAIGERAPGARVVMLASTPDDRGLLPALSAGASGCLVGAPDAPALARAVRDVLAGNTAVPRAVLTRLVAGYDGA